MKAEREPTIWQTHQGLTFNPVGIFKLYETQFLVKQGEGKKRGYYL